MIKDIKRFLNTFKNMKINQLLDNKHNKCLEVIVFTENLASFVMN